MAVLDAFPAAGKARKLRQLVRGHFGLRQNLAALDVGCGIALIHGHLSGVFGKLFGADVSAEALNQALAENAGNTYRTYDGHKLPFPDACFDVCYTICLMHHVPPAQWPDFLKEMRRVLKPGGLMVVFEHNPFNPLTLRAVNACHFDHDAVLLRPGSLAKLAQQAAFNTVQCRFIFFTPFASPFFRRLDDCLNRVPLGGQYYLTAIR